MQAWFIFEEKLFDFYKWTNENELNIICFELRQSLNKVCALFVFRYDEYTYKSVSSKALGNADNKQHYVFIYK